MNYFLHNSDVSVDLKNNDVKVHTSKAEPFKVTMVDTGLETMTAGRLKQIKDYVKDDDFMLTYGDGVADVDIEELIRFHNSHGKVATMTAVQPSSRFGIIELGDGNLIEDFVEKPQESGSWINGGFFVLKPAVFDYLKDNADEVMWEKQPLEDLAKDREIYAYKHSGFWKCMDTMRDKEDLEYLWNENPKWKTW